MPNLKLIIGTFGCNLPPRMQIANGVSPIISTARKQPHHLRWGSYSR